MKESGEKVTCDNTYCDETMFLPEDDDLDTWGWYDIEGEHFCPECWTDRCAEHKSEERGIALAEAIMLEG